MGPARWLQVLATSLLLVLSFPRPDVGILGAIALVPLLRAVSGARGTRAFLAGWAAAILWLFISYNWVSNSLAVYGQIPFPLDKVAVLIMAALQGVYLGMFAAVVPTVSSRRLAVRLLVLPSAWVLLEVARTWFPAPFPWLLLGTAFWKTPFLSSLYPLAGVYGASFWAVCVNVLIWSLPGGDRRSGATAWGLLGAFCCLPFALSLLPHGAGKGELKVGIVQGNFRQELKWEESLAVETIDTYLDLTDRAVDEGAVVVVWPETAVTSFYQAEPELRGRLRKYSATRDVHLVFGSPGYEIQGTEVLLYNRVYHLAPDGKEEFYDKIQLVPFGEYIPFFGGLTFVERLVPGDGEFARGAWKRPFSTPVPSGALVCYEVSFPGLARREAADGADMIVNVTNDAWFGRTWGPYQHLAISAVRAAENRVPLLRAANTGVSAVIDDRGRIVDTIPLDARGVIVANIVTGRGATIYTRWGDWIVTFCATVIALFVLISIAGWRNQRWISWTVSKTRSPGQ